MKHLLHRDQVHRDTYFDPISIALINTQQMQRLGRVYQLGFAHLVYRGGTHTRLSHVMGAAHVSELLVKALKNNYKIAFAGECVPVGAIHPDIFLPKLKNQDIKDIEIEDRWDVLKHLVKWGALLHDIGHIPFGHTLEDEFSDIYKKHDSFKSPRMDYLWNESYPSVNSEIKEIFTNKKNNSLFPNSFKNLNISGTQVWNAVMMICLYKKENHVSQKVENEIADAEFNETGFKEIYKNAYLQTHGFLFHQYMADIVSDTICADYIDYIQRDTLNVGLDSINELRIIHSYYVGKNSTDNELRMALSLVDKGGKPKLSICTAAKNMVRHRFDLAEIIYYHKTKAAASAMLAKVFSLIEAPDEKGSQRTSIPISDIKLFAEKLMSGGSNSVKNLRNNFKPNSLLHPAMGDETMLYWLQEKAWEKIDKAVKEKHNIQLEKSLLALSLLEGITQRKLYKVAMSIDADIVKNSQTEHSDRVETEISNIIETYRKSKTTDKEKNRESLEKSLSESINWPDGSFICYVPDRKSQAKGIETGALDYDGKVITLGEHNAVRDEVKMLNKNYKDLWRFLLFVHPDYMKNINNNCIELSKAADLLFVQLFPTINLDEKVEVIKRACWFHYIAPRQRTAAKIYVDALGEEKNQNIQWKFFDKAIDTLSDSTANPQEMADRATLLRLYVKDGEPDQSIVNLMKSYFGEAGSLEVEIGKLIVEKQFSKDGNEEIEGRMLAISKIVDLIKSQDRPGKGFDENTLFSRMK